MKKVIISLMFALFAVENIQSQIEVGSFRLLENDFAANRYATMVKDMNGEVAALIKIVTTEQGFVFDGGSVGIVKTKQHVGEIWVYVPYGIQRITIQHPRLGVLRDYYFPVAIEKACTYELVLKTPKAKNDTRKGMLNLVYTPVEAKVNLDGYDFPAGNGSFQNLFNYGEYTYKLSARGYESKEGVFVIDSAKVNLRVELPKLPILTLKAPEADGAIYLDGVLVGTGQWTDTVAIGTYTAEVRKEGFLSMPTTIELVSGDERTITLEAPQSLKAHLTVKSPVKDGQIYLNGELKGTTEWTGELDADTYEIELRMKNRTSLRDTVTLAQREQRTVTMEEQYGRLVAMTRDSIINVIEAKMVADSIAKAEKKAMLAAKRSAKVSNNHSNPYWRSLLIPGWGDKYVRENGRFGVMKTIGSYGLIGAGVGMHFYAEKQYQQYLSMAYELYTQHPDIKVTQEQRNTLAQSLETANQYRKTVPVLIGAGAAVWLYDVVWVAVKGRKSKNTTLAVDFDPQTNNGLLSYSITF